MGEVAAELLAGEVLRGEVCSGGSCFQFAREAATGRFHWAALGPDPTVPALRGGYDGSTVWIHLPDLGVFREAAEAPPERWLPGGVRGHWPEPFGPEGLEVLLALAESRWELEEDEAGGQATLAAGPWSGARLRLETGPEGGGPSLELALAGARASFAPGSAETLGDRVRVPPGLPLHPLGAAPAAPPAWLQPLSAADRETLMNLGYTGD